MSWVLERINKSLFNWIHNKKTYLKWYKLGISEQRRINSTLMIGMLGI
jgi:hypothetical protein